VPAGLPGRSGSGQMGDEVGSPQQTALWQCEGRREQREPHRHRPCLAPCSSRCPTSGTGRPSPAGSPVQLTPLQPLGRMGQVKRRHG